MGKILLTAGLLLILSILIFNQEAADAGPDGRSSGESKSGENKSGKNDSKHSGSGEEDGDYSKENSDEDDCYFNDDDDDDDDSSGHNKKDSRENSEQKKKKPHDGSVEENKNGSHSNSGEKDKKHHCREYNDTLSHDELVTLQYTLVFLQTQGEGCTGYILFKGKYIPVDFIFTFIYIRGKSTSQLTVYGLRNIMQIYRAREQHSNSDGSEYHISKGELITLQYILLCIQKNCYSDQGKIEYIGYFIPIQDLKYYSDQNSINFTSMTVEQLLLVINICIQNKGDTTSPGIPLGPQPTEDQNTKLEIIVRFLSTQNNNYNLDFTFYGYKINTSFIIIYLQRDNMDIKNINHETMWQIIKLAAECNDNRNGRNSGGNNKVTPSSNEE